MRGRDRLGILVTLGVLVVDQVTKWIVSREMVLHQTIEIIPRYLNLCYLRNTGAAFGLFSSSPRGLHSLALIALSVAAAAVIIVIWVRSRSAGPFFVTVLALILGGALGNLIDRILWGEVIDFVDVHIDHLHWPAFNAADSAISLGVAGLIIHLLFHPGPDTRRESMSP